MSNCSQQIDAKLITIRHPTSAGHDRDNPVWRMTTDRNTTPMARRTRVLHILKVARPDFSGEAAFFERSSVVMDALAPHATHDLLTTVTAAPARPLPSVGVLGRRIFLGPPSACDWCNEARLVWWLLRNIGRYDVVHVRTHADWYFLSYLLAKLRGRRLLLSATLDDSVPGLVRLYSPGRRWLVRRLFRLFDGFVSVSAKLQAETASVMPAGRCHLIEYGIVFPRSDRARGMALRAELGIAADALVFVFVGGLCARKDPMLLVRSHAAILRERPDAWLLLVGPPLEPDYVAAMRAQAEADGSAHRILYIGEVANPHLYFEAADIMAFASTLEGFGMVVPEAMGHGLPVVVRALPGVNDAFARPEETALVFEADADYLPLALRLVREPELRARIGEAGRRLVRARYDIERVARRYLDAYGIPPAEPVAEATDGPTPEDLQQLRRTASVLDPALHAPLAEAQAAAPRLIVLADAEEAFEWNGTFSRHATDVRSMAWQHRAHEIYDRYGVRPTYLVDHLVATEDAGRAPLRELLASGSCDIGAQLHPWVTPPFAEETTPWNSYLGNLPLWLQRAKIERLIEAIEAEFGLRPRIFRAGRYGVGPRTAELLQSLGFLADSSAMPCWDYRADGGPDFLAASCRPHWIDPGRSLLEIPTTAAFVGRLSAPPPWLVRLLFSRGAERVGMTAAVARAGLIERIRLSPEGTTPAEARRLVRALLQARQRIFVISYHTSSLQPGNTPYVRSQADLGRFLGWLDEVLDFFRSEVGGSFTTWREIREDATATAAAPPAPAPPPRGPPLPEAVAAG